MTPADSKKPDRGECWPWLHGVPMAILRPEFRPDWPGENEPSQWCDGLRWLTPEGPGGYRRSARRKRKEKRRRAWALRSAETPQSQTWMRGLYQMPRYPSQTGAPRVQ